MGETGIEVLIPIIAIIMVFSIPIVAIIMDYRKRALQAEERRAMIEKGMVPPDTAVDEGYYGRSIRSPETLRMRSLRAGTILLFLGIGLLLAYALLTYVVDAFIVPARVVGMMAAAGAIVGFLGIGNLVYYKLSAPKPGSTG